MMCDRIQYHERMIRYIQHRERVLNVQSVVKTQIERSRSTPPRRNPRKQAEDRRRLNLENKHVMRSLVNLAKHSNQCQTSDVCCSGYKIIACQRRKNDEAANRRWESVTPPSHRMDFCKRFIK
ncbi:hypothetical protein DICVIV_09307 [Dictyocaulus viviparus]|uniref:Uncharacterized protein n=1 Tax=Dictyocaulus viviparus TaxID=29172 RepID=A0A0D8XJ47_DICVI|nr:hypothetical protein DICVIV_09307 [Dictyocaulus viviparus]